MLDPRHRNRLHNLGNELAKLGIKVTTVEDNPYIDSENATHFFPPDRN